MAKPEITTVGESLHWSYANLAMAHAAVEDGSQRFGKKHFIIRSRLFWGLKKGTMSIGSFADDDRLKMLLPQACSYCGSKDRLSIDHLVPSCKGGGDSGDNVVWACRSCNSSKGGKDLLEWMAVKDRFPPLLLLRRYLKLVMEWCEAESLMECPIDQVEEDLPFSFDIIPHSFPRPGELVLWQPGIEADEAG